jgi:hypothetical protein
MYAFGVLMWEVLSGQLAFIDTSYEALRKLLVDGNRPDLTNLAVVSELKQLITSCWDSDRSKRPTALDCVRVLDQHYQSIVANQRDMFFSHAWADKPFLRHVYGRLLQANLLMWYDEEDMGHDIKESMAQGIAQSKVVLVCLSKTYVTRPNCLFELREAARQGRSIVVLLLDGIEGWKENITHDNKLIEEISDICQFSTKMYVDASCIVLPAGLTWENVVSTEDMGAMLDKFKEVTSQLARVIDHALSVSKPTSLKLEGEVQLGPTDVAKALRPPKAPLGKDLP